MAKHSPDPLPPLVSEVKILLGKGAWDKIFVLVDENEEHIPAEKFQDYLSIKAAYGSLKKQIIKNTIALDDRQLEEARITDRLLSWLQGLVVDSKNRKLEKGRLAIAAVALSFMGLLLLLFGTNKLEVFPTYFSWNFGGTWQLTLQSEGCPGVSEDQVYVLRLNQIDNRLVGSAVNTTANEDQLLFSGVINANARNIDATISSPGGAVIPDQIRQVFSFSSGSLLPPEIPDQVAEPTACSQFFKLEKIDS